MKKLLLLLLLVFANAMQAQTIRGYIYDEQDLPLEGAFVYLDGTTINASTNAKGYFELKSASVINAVMVVSFIGFEKFYLENPFSYDKPVKVIMKESATMLDEVVIDRKLPFTRKEMMKVFREQFLGKTAAGKSCRIENEDDIRLGYNTTTNALYASCKNPIRIVNKRLEYTIAFNLVNFEVEYNALTLSPHQILKSFYAGTTAFTDVSKNGSADKKRKKAYLGSTVHLMKTMAANTWEKEKFQLYVDKWPVDPINYFAVKDTLSFKKIDALKQDAKGMFTLTDAATGKTSKIETYKSIKYQVLYDGKEQSVFELTDGRIYVDPNGLFIPVDGIMFGGYLAGLKAGDLLPVDYNYTP